jgi:hypothetical protein
MNIYNTKTDPEACRQEVFCNAAIGDPLSKTCIYYRTLWLVEDPYTFTINKMIKSNNADTKIIVQTKSKESLNTQKQIEVASALRCAVM